MGLYKVNTQSIWLKPPPQFGHSCYACSVYTVISIHETPHNLFGNKNSWFVLIRRRPSEFTLVHHLIHSVISVQSAGYASLQRTARAR